jgi:hypothetical protein
VRKSGALSAARILKAMCLAIAEVGVELCAGHPEHSVEQGMFVCSYAEIKKEPKDAKCRPSNVLLLNEVIGGKRVSVNLSFLLAILHLSPYSG